MSLAAGTPLGPYEIHSQVGAGGMGVVYRAKDTRLNRMVAVKVLSSESALPELKQRFEREAQTIAGLAVEQFPAVAASVKNPPRAVLYNVQIKRSEIMKKGGKRTDPRKATQRFAEKSKLRATAIGGRRKRAVTLGMSAEMSSLEENAERFARYAGQWLLLAGGKLIAHSEDYLVIAGEIARRSLKDGLVYYMPKPEESNFVLV